MARRRYRNAQHYHKHYHYHDKKPLWLRIVLWIFVIFLLIVVGRFALMFYNDIVRMLR